MPKSSTRTIVNALLTVLKVEQLSKSYLRLHFRCEKPLEVDPLWICPHVKLLFAEPTTGEITFPKLDENNKIVVNDKIRKLARSYSIRHYDAVTNQLVIDFVIHPTGLASVWAQQAKVGDQIGLVGAASKLAYHQQNLVLIGDVSAVPAISYTLENLPAQAKVQAFLAVNDQSDILPLSFSADFKVTWLVANSHQPDEFIETIKGADIPNSCDLFFWGGMECNLARLMRQTLKDKYRDLSPDAIHMISYWREGYAEGEFKHRD